MLVLTRKVGERIIIGKDLCITVVGIRGHQVRLGFEAPPQVPIFREELGLPPYRSGDVGGPQGNQVEPVD